MELFVLHKWEKILKVVIAIYWELRAEFTNVFGILKNIDTKHVIKHYTLYLELTKQLTLIVIVSLLESCNCMLH